MFEDVSKEIDSEALSEFSPYMVSRYFSFYENGKYIDYLNNTVNKYHNIFKTPEDQYRFFENVIPKVKRKKIQYVKKIKKQKVENVKQIPDFYSKKEWDLLTKIDN